MERTTPAQPAVGPLLDYPSAAAYLDCSERLVRELWARRQLSGVKVGRFVRFTTEDLDNYIRSRRVSAAS